MLINKLADLGVDVVARTVDKKPNKLDQQTLIKQFAMDAIGASEEVGRGANNIVYAVPDTTDQVLRVDFILPFSTRRRLSFLSEIYFQKTLSNMFPSNVPSVAKLYYTTYVFEDDECHVWGVLMSRFTPFFPFEDKSRTMDSIYRHPSDGDCTPLNTLVHRAVVHSLRLIRELGAKRLFHADANEENIRLATTGMQLIDFGESRFVPCANNETKEQRLTDVVIDNMAVDVTDSYQTSPPEHLLPLMDPFVAEFLNDESILALTSASDFAKTDLFHKDGKPKAIWDALSRLNEIASMTKSVLHAIHTDPNLTDVRTDFSQLCYDKLRNENPFPIASVVGVYNDLVRNSPPSDTMCDNAIKIANRVRNTVRALHASVAQHYHTYSTQAVIIYHYACALTRQLVRGAAAHAMGGQYKTDVGWVVDNNNKANTIEKRSINTFEAHEPLMLLRDHIISDSSSPRNSAAWRALVLCLHPDPTMRTLANIDCELAKL